MKTTAGIIMCLSLIIIASSLECKKEPILVQQYCGSCHFENKSDFTHMGIPKDSTHHFVWGAHPSIHPKDAEAIVAYIQSK